MNRCTLWLNADELTAFVVLRFAGFLENPGGDLPVTRADIFGVGVGARFEGIQRLSLVARVAGATAETGPLQVFLAGDPSSTTVTLTASVVVGDWVVLRLRQRNTGTVELGQRCGEVQSAAAGERGAEAACDDVVYVTIGGAEPTDGSYTPDGEGSGIPFHGDIAEVIGYSRGLTDAEVAEVESYLVEKYALATCGPMPCFTYRSDTVLTTTDCALTAVDPELSQTFDTSAGWVLHNRRTGASPIDLLIGKDGGGNPCSPSGNPHEVIINTPFQPAASAYLELVPGVITGGDGPVPALRQPRLTTGMTLPPTPRAYADPGLFHGPDGWTVCVVVQLDEAPVGAGTVASGNLETLFGSVDGVLTVAVSSDGGVQRLHARYAGVEIRLKIPTMLGRPLIGILQFNPANALLTLSEFDSGRAQGTLPVPAGQTTSGVKATGLQLLAPATNANAAGVYAEAKDFFEFRGYCSLLPLSEVKRIVEELAIRYDVVDPPLQGIDTLS